MDKLGGLTSRQWLEDKFSAAKVITVATSTGAYYDKYGRYLATVYADGVNLNALMVAEGLAAIYVEG